MYQLPFTERTALAPTVPTGASIQVITSNPAYMGIISNSTHTLKNCKLIGEQTTGNNAKPEAHILAISTTH